MKTFQLISLGIIFAMAGLSAMMFYGHGFATWCWQLITMSLLFRLFMNEWNKK